MGSQTEFGNQKKFIIFAPKLVQRISGLNGYESILLKVNASWFNLLICRQYNTLNFHLEQILFIEILSTMD